MSRFSIIPARAVYDATLSPHALKVLCAIGVHADRHGWAYPSLKTIGNLIGCSRQAVSGHIKSLISAGYLESRVQKRKDGGQSSNLYRILMDVGEPENQEIPSGGDGTGLAGGDGQLFDTITSHTNDQYRDIPPDGGEPPKLKRKSSLPPDWEIVEDDPNHLYAKSKGMTWAEMEIEEAQFKNHHIAKGNVMADWRAAWRTWVNNWVKFKEKGFGKAQGR